MKTNKRLAALIFCKNVVKQFVTITLLTLNKTRYTNYFTKLFLKIIYKSMLLRHPLTFSILYVTNGD